MEPRSRYFGACRPYGPGGFSRNWPRWGRGPGYRWFEVRAGAAPEDVAEMADKLSGLGGLGAQDFDLLAALKKGSQEKVLGVYVVDALCATTTYTPLFVH